MRYLFVHQNFPGQFRHVAAALAARGHEVVALGVNRTAESFPGVSTCCTANRRWTSRRTASTRSPAR